MRAHVGRPHRGAPAHRSGQRSRDPRGAFGCGPQGFAPELPISLFKAWIGAHPGAIAHITFAVPRASFDAFDAAFGEKKAPEPEVVPTAVADEDVEDDFDFDPADLPEGVTLRA